MTPEMISAGNISIGYGKRVLAEGIAFSVGAGRLFFVAGSNGAGKSTLIRTLGGYLPALAGEVRLAGADIKKMTPGERARIAAYLPGETYLPYDFSLREIALMGRFPVSGGISYSAKDFRAAEEAMAAAGIAGIADKGVNSVSSGERQLAFLAQAMARDARIYLLDEPTSHLDINFRCKILALIKKIAQERGISALIVSHDLELMRKFADGIFAIGRDGRFMALSKEKFFSAETISAIYGQSALDLI